MGVLFYGSQSLAISADDRVLAHLKVAVLTKLRRGEAFALSWHDADTRHTVWVNGASTLHFEFNQVERPAVNSRWVSNMIEAATMTGELTILPEPPE